MIIDSELIVTRVDEIGIEGLEHEIECIEQTEFNQKAFEFLKKMSIGYLTQTVLLRTVLYSKGFIQTLEGSWVKGTKAYLKAMEDGFDSCPLDENGDYGYNCNSDDERYPVNPYRKEILRGFWEKGLNDAIQKHAPYDCEDEEESGEEESGEEGA
jgi:hypothetical protein